MHKAVMGYSLRFATAKLENKTQNLVVKIKNAFARLEHKTLEPEYRSTVKLGSVVTVVIAAATAVIKFL